MPRPKVLRALLHFKPVQHRSYSFCLNSDGFETKAKGGFHYLASQNHLKTVANRPWRPKKQPTFLFRISIIWVVPAAPRCLLNPQVDGMRHVSSIVAPWQPSPCVRLSTRCTTSPSFRFEGRQVKADRGRNTKKHTFSVPEPAASAPLDIQVSTKELGDLCHYSFMFWGTYFWVKHQQ